MHWCPDCGEPCFCDGDDVDFGEYNCKIHCGCERPEDSEDPEDYDPEEERALEKKNNSEED